MNYIKTIIIVLLVVILSTILTAEKLKKLEMDSKKQLSINKDYKNILVTLLIPTVEKAVDDFYEPYLTNNPMVMPYDIELKDVQYVRNDTKNFVKYIVTIVVPPFLGPHRYIGKERIVLNIDASGNVSVKKYEHLKSEKISQFDEPLLIKPLPSK